MTLPDPGEWPATDAVDYPIGDLLRERARSTPDATAIVDADSGKGWTYAEFDDRVSDRFAGLAAELDSDEPRVGLLLDTGVAFAELYFATARAGATLVPLNVRLDEGTLASQAQQAGVDCLVCDADTADVAASIAPDGVDPVRVDEVDGSEVSGAPGASGTSSASDDDQGPPPAPVEATGDADRLILFTSGTTGEPKGVRLTLDNLASSAVGSAERLDVSPDDRWLVCLPTYHMGGLAPLVRSTLYGTTTVLQSEFDAAETAGVLDEYDVTCVSLVPTMLRRLLDEGWEPPERLRFVLLGGGPAPPSLVDRCEERGVPVCPTYGATETASQVATALPDEAFDHRGTVGRPLRVTDVTLVDESGDPVGVGDVGELVVDGPTVTPGYLDAGQTSAAFGERGFETGDLGRRDEEGRLWVVGRVDDRIVTGGENVQPAVVAAAVRELVGVTDVAVLGLPDEEWGERVAALVASADGSLDPATVRSHCRDELAEFEVPKTVRVVDSLPRTASGTVDRERARALLAGEDG